MDSDKERERVKEKKREKYLEGGSIGAAEQEGLKAEAIEVVTSDL